MYLLSICIPSRNRPQALFKTVGAIQKQIITSKASDKVEIVISDNTDQDNLKINSTAFKDKNIHYLTNFPFLKIICRGLQLLGQLRKFTKINL